MGERAAIIYLLDVCPNCPPSVLRDALHDVMGRDVAARPSPQSARGHGRDGCRARAVFDGLLVCRWILVSRMAAGKRLKM